jgi:hypothetical protein
MGVSSLLPLASAGIGAATGGKSGGTAPGGISGEQAALAQYGFGQNMLAARSNVNQGFPGTSTMETQATTGARNQLAETEAKQSDVNQQLQIAANSQLQKLAEQQQQQSGFGAGSGGFGSSGGSAGNTGGSSSSSSSSSDAGTTETG